MSQSSVRTKRKGSQPLVQTDNPSPPKKKRLTQDLLNRRAGTINRMILKNFMCHSLLDVDLRQPINVLIGRNGSGKSAILTALIVGLGGKASLTNRGNSIKSFIKAGKTNGSIEIEIYNAGPMSFRPKIYGKTITVIRSFSQTGSTGYRIKSATGETISTKVKDLAAILIGLNIQVDNPISILNQDTSRNFLSSNDPKHKYTLFMRATRLELLDEEYKLIMSNRGEAEQLYDNKSKDYKALHDEYKKLEVKVANHMKINETRDKLSQAQCEMLWAKVRDSETELLSLENELKDLLEKQKKLDDNNSTRSDRIKKAKERIAELSQQIAEVREAAKVQQQPQNQLKRVIEDLVARRNAKKHEKQLLYSQIQNKQQDGEILEKEIRNANDNINRVEQEKIKRLQAINEKKSKLNEIKEKIQTTQNDLFQYVHDYSRDTNRDNLREEIAKFDRQLHNDRTTLASLKSDSNNTLSLYGRDMPRIKEMIDKYKQKFKQIPKGPLGTYIKLKDKKWAVAVEGFLGVGLLNAFVVDNESDNKVLMQIFNAVLGPGGRKPTIITSKFFFKKHDVRNNLVRVPSGCQSLYEAIDIEDPVVSNCIVDQKSIEGILLIPNDDLAIRLLSNRNNVPDNCTQAITAKGDTYFPDPNYKTYGSLYHRAVYLQVDTKNLIRGLEDNIRDLTEKKETAKIQLNKINAAISEQNAKKSRLEQEILKLTSIKRQCQRELDEILAVAEPEVASVELLTNELEQVKGYIEAKKINHSQVCEELKELTGEIEANQTKLNELKNTSSDLEERVRNLEGQVNEQENVKREIIAGEEFEKRKIRELQTKLNQIRTDVDSKTKLVEKYMGQAQNVGERPKTIREIYTIADSIKSMENNLRRIEAETEDCTEIIKKMESLNQKLENLKKLMKIIGKDIDELGKVMDRRKKQFSVLENYFITYIKHSFKTFMEIRHFEGSMTININEKKLELNVIPHKGIQGITTTSNLSGGERSFSTVAFLYSLWQCMDFPFYFLDEFDVYMDKLNRTKVFDVLLAHAKLRPDLQFVFLTPQDVSFIKDDVSILRLEDPERGQQ